jgi:hypothetical protein
VWDGITQNVPLIWGKSNPDAMRHFNTTGKLRITRMRELPVGQIRQRLRGPPLTSD